MALKLLQPGLTPMGQFDLLDSFTPVGGEVGKLQARTAVDGSDAYASDAITVGPQAEIAAGQVAAGGTGLYGLVDEGSAGEGNYGTLFGQVIGGTAGQGTGKGTLSNTGVVTVGPATYLASGKATFWAQRGLYGISGTAASEISGLDVGIPLGSTAQGKLESSTNTDTVHVAVYCGAVNDSSLVSTTFTHASGSASDAEYHAVFFRGLTHTA